MLYLSLSLFIYKMIIFIVLLCIYQTSCNAAWQAEDENCSVIDRSLFNNIGKGLDGILSVLNMDKIVNQLTLHQNIDPEASMTVNEIIQYHGYPVENYDVQTDDGYILTIQRIPYGKREIGFTPRKPVLIQHGIMSSSGIWFANTPDKILPYILADAGYDVWLGNFRGTAFGKRHVNLSPNYWKFWKYSFEDMADQDIPKIIDKMLNVTGYSNIYYIGHSMGTTTAFAMLSSNAKYNDIIKAMFALAPIVTVTHMQGLIRYVVIFLKYFGWLLDFLHINLFYISPTTNWFLSRVLCNSPLKGICRRIIFDVSGDDYSQFNFTRLPVFLHHTPDTTSLQNFLQVSQIFYAGKLQRRDYGRKANLKKYGKPYPPEFDVTKITTPVALFWSDNDKLADPKDVAWLLSHLKFVAYNCRIPYKDFAHLDFTWATDVKSLVYDRLVEIMSEMWH